MHPLLRLFRYARPYRRDIVLATLYSILNKFFDVLPEVLIGVAVDVVVNRESSFLAKVGIVDAKNQLIWLAALTAVIWMCESLFEYLYSLKWRNLAQRLQHDLRLDTYRHVQRLEMGYFENQRTGNLLSIINDDINQMERFLNGGVNDILQVFVSSILVSAVFFVLTPAIAVISLVPVPFILYGAFWFQHKLAPRYTAVREAAGSLNGRLNNNLLGVATIKAYAAEQFEADKIAEGSDDYRVRNAAAIRLAAAITPVIRMAILAGFIATLLYGGLLTLRGELAVGSYSVLVYLTQRLLWPMTRLADMTDLYQRSMASIERALNLLDTPIRIPYEGRRLAVKQVRGEIVFDQVGFAYGEQTPRAGRGRQPDGAAQNEAGQVLHNISLTVPAGHTVAFVGSTGSGKSTLVKLLLRFYEPQHGRILLDGMPIDELDLQDLRRAIGYVSQDTFLADGSVADNIAYGMPDAARENVIAAAVAAEAHEFIMALPHGYDTHVGERGQKLSGGQRQRLALARAILKNPPILVLDEATSAVDNETEAAIQRSLERLVVDRSSIIIAHRLSTVRHAERICVMDGGRIAESGTHDELLARNGQYAALWRLQTGERPEAALAS